MAQYVIVKFKRDYQGLNRGERASLEIGHAQSLEKVAVLEIEGPLEDEAAVVPASDSSSPDSSGPESGDGGDGALNSNGDTSSGPSTELAFNFPARSVLVAASLNTVEAVAAADDAALLALEGLTPERLEKVRAAVTAYRAKQSQG